MKKNFTIERTPTPAYNTFVLLARLGTFTRAGDHLGISASAVSQQIRRLEAQVGTRLFNRTSRQVALTEAGQQLLTEVTPALEMLDLALQRVRARQHGPSGLLRINTSRLAAGLLIEPRIDEFLARYPDLKLELFTDDTFADIVREGFDAGIRLGPYLANDVVSVPLDNGQPVGVVASSAYLERMGTPKSPLDLAHHDCIRYRFAGSKRLESWHFQIDGQDTEVDVHGRLIFSDNHYIIRATCKGYGLAQLFLRSIRSELERGELVPVLQDHAPMPTTFHLYFAARQLMPPKLRALIDFLREPLQETSAAQRD
ncbi:LysR family transcriptional regulator [Diaphorobacter aerolatus]|uniref:LysR family transcriptional regulator n=1 Tax=Diaphorobacter aerolatus TaxID=1288495 RepID=A0A7H0GM25_9BURK|nr:LysR family transcriptional regulator [Diaphorobacter aerolatus]QNP49341.1 LysR family transcriptional regulator [Diaphorobacter aerolatus]